MYSGKSLIFFKFRNLSGINLNRTEKGSVEMDMNRFSSPPNYENRNKTPASGLSELGEQGFFFF